MDGLHAYGSLFCPLREFYQCDFDVAGVYSSMVPDAEVLAVTTEILTSLQLGDFEIKLSHRKLLDAMLQIAGEGAEQPSVAGWDSG